MTRPGDRLMLGVLALDAAVLAILELFFLPLRINDLASPQAMSWLPHALYIWPLPISVVAAVTTPLLVVQAGKYAKGPLGISAPLLVWLLVCLLIGVGGPGGDVVLVNDWRSLALLLIGAIGGAAAVGRTLGKQSVAASS